MQLREIIESELRNFERKQIFAACGPKLNFLRHFVFAGRLIVLVVNVAPSHGTVPTYCDTHDSVMTT